MNPLHFHLLLNHLPVFGIVFSLGLLLFALFRKSNELKRVALGCLVLTAVATIPAFLTGEPAEEIVSRLPGVSKTIIEKHEELAEVAFASLSILGAAALVALVATRRKPAIPAWIAGSFLVCCLAVSSLMAWTANLGGQVRRPELRTQADVQTTLQTTVTGQITQ